MSGWLWALLIFAVLMVLLYLSNVAGRLDRLHKRVELSQLNMQRALERRRDISELAATSGLLDPASSLLIADAVGRVDSVDPADVVSFGVAESDLTSVLGVVFGDVDDVDAVVAEPGGEVVGRLADSCRRVEIGRRFYNDAVFATREMRKRRMVRWFRLQGTAVLPEPFEMNDTVPAGFAGR